MTRRHFYNFPGLLISRLKNKSPIFKQFFLVRKIRGTMANQKYKISLGISRLPKFKTASLETRLESSTYPFLLPHFLAHSLTP